MARFTKYPRPVLGGAETGTLFDAYVRRDGARLRMDVSWRPKKSLAVSYSDDGVSWTPPEVTLPPVPGSEWEADVNRCCVLRDGGGYTMWYTGQANGKSRIGRAVSPDGTSFRRVSDSPVLSPELAWEGESVMNPCVLCENGRYRMWYSAGETYEPNVIGYAESPDGIVWTKRPEPIFGAGTAEFERDRVGGCQVLRFGDEYLLFYIGYRDIDTACVCLARSPDGVSGWVREPDNPLVSPTPDAWDADSCYKPTAVFDERSETWKLWYNGRNGHVEYIGMAEGMI